MSVEAGTPGTPAPGSSGSSTPPTPGTPDSDARLTAVNEQVDLAQAMEESDELRRRRRHRRRRTVADLPPAQKRFRLILLGLVILSIIVAANGKEIRPVIDQVARGVRSALPLAAIQKYLRPELFLLAIAVFIMVVLLFPDVEEKVLSTLGFQKTKRPHRSRSSRNRSGSGSSSRR